MSDLLGAALGITNGLTDSAEPPVNALLDAYRRTQAKPINDLNARKSTLEKNQVYFNSLRSSLESLTDLLAEFGSSNISLDTFGSKKASSSDTSVVTAKADAGAFSGLTSIKVNRLATNDILVSDRLNATDASGYAAGTFSFDLTIGATTRTIDVTFDGTEDFQSALAKIANAVNAEDDLDVSAGVVFDTSSTVRLSLATSSEGAENRIEFSDTDSVLAPLGLDAALFADANNRTAFDDTSAGYRTSDSDELDASFQLNGINITRGSNVIDDVVEGLTFTLRKVQDAGDAAVTITSETDPDGVRNNLNPLLEKYNNLLEVLNNPEGDTGRDVALRSLRSSVRQAASSELTNGTFKYLSDIGITFDTDGKLRLSDLSALEDAVEQDAQAVADLVSAFADNIDSRLGSLLGEDGLISARKDSISVQIRNIDRRVDTLEKRVDIQAEALRKQYESYQLIYSQAQAQFSLISSFSANSTLA